MKKILMLLVLVMFFAVACGEDSETDTNDDATIDDVETGDDSDKNEDDKTETPDSGCTAKFPRSFGGLCWSNASKETMKWGDAIDFCTDLGGRLPNISELRTLIKNCPATEHPKPSGQDDDWCGVESDCSSLECYLSGLDINDFENTPCTGCAFDEESSGKYSVFGHTVRLWSSSIYEDTPDYGWYVFFYSGHVSFNPKADLYHVVCLGV
jgi:hypothetical protein